MRRTLSREFNGHSLAYWIIKTYRLLNKQTPLPTSYAYENMALSLLFYFQRGSSVNPAIAASDIHDGWVTNFNKWKSRLPEKDIERRTFCATTTYENLPLHEQKKDLEIAVAIINLVKTHNNQGDGACACE